MSPKKFKNFLQGLPVVLCALFVGCATTTGDASATAAGIIRSVVPFGVEIAVGQEPASKPYIALASQAIRGAANGGHFDVATIQAAIAAASINELHTTAATTAINAGLALYSTFAGNAVSNAVNNAKLSVVLLAVADSLDAGLAMPPIVFGKTTPTDYEAVFAENLKAALRRIPRL